MRECMVLLAALAFAAQAAEPEEGPGQHVRVQREIQGVFPHPRVGRASWSTWATRDSGLGENKRQGLIPFPRVGRSENSDPRMVPAAWLLAPEYYSGKRGEVMRFPSAGPRLGRENKGLGDDWALYSLREYPSMSRSQRGRDSSSFTPRLGRELESDEEVLPRPEDDAILARSGPGPRT